MKKGFINFLLLFPVLLLGSTENAHAVDPSDWIVDPAPLMDASSAPIFSAHGVGSPAVTYDQKNGDYVAAFEYWSGNTSPLCPRGIWGMAIARSSDGLNWNIETSFEPTPGDGSPHSCVMSHPSVMWGEKVNGSVDYTSLHVWFKAEQGTDACDAVTPAWGCNLYTGVGNAIVEFKGNGTVKNVSVAPDLNVMIDTPFGFSDVIQRGDNVYLMLVQVGADLYAVESASEHTGWGARYLVQSPGTYTWNQTEVISPSLMCQDDGTLQSFTGGRTSGGDSGWAPAFSSDGGNSWSWPDNPQFTWNNNNDWRHWSALRVGPTVDDYLVWWTDKDGAGRLRLRFASTVSSWDPNLILDRRCD